MSVTKGRLLVVAPSAYTLGGLATWLDYLLPGLTELGWDVTLGLVSGPRHHQPQRYLDIHPFAKIASIHCDCSTSSGRIKAVRKAIADVQPDVVLTVNIPDAVRATALERSAGRNVRAVMTCHGIQEDLFADMRCLRDELDAVVCTNQLACRLAEELGTIESDRIFHCAYGTTVPAQMPARPDNKKFTIGYSGRLEQPQKRIHDLVSIAARLRDHDRDVQFLIAGSGPEEEAFRASIQQQGLADSFTFLGFVSPEQMEDRFYKAVDVLLVTSCWETGPIVIWEAMAVGTPVVTSRYTGSGQERLLWHQQNCRMFDIGDSIDAAAQLMSLCDDSEQYHQIRQRAFETVSSQLSCQVSSAKWNAVLEQLVRTTPRNSMLQEQPAAAPTGRLDRLLGTRIASATRRLLKRLPPDSGPGGEWPHTVVGATMDEEVFFELAAKLDRRKESVVESVG